MSDEIEADVSGDMTLDGTPASEPAVTETQEAPVEAPVESSPWDSFKTLPEFEGQDDKAIASHLYQAMQREQAASRALQQYQQVMPVAQEYLANRSAFEEWRKAQASGNPNPQNPQPNPEPKQSWWNPPEVKDTYKRYLSKDENGRDVIHPDAPLDARAALTDWMDYRAEFAQKFLSNPEETLGPMVQEMAQRQAQEIIENSLKQRDDESFVSRVEEENRDWLFDQETGSVSPAGLLVHKYIEEGKQLGINGPEARWNYAVAMAERQMLASQFDNRPPPQQQIAPQEPAPQPAPEPAPVQDQAQKNMEYLRREASRRPSRSAGAANAGDPRQPQPKRSFEQMLMEEASGKGLV